MTMLQTEDLTTKARIRNDALALFSERGEQRVSMRQIAARAGVAVGSIQHHFGTREGLLQAVNDWVVNCFQDAINSADETATAPRTPRSITAARDRSVQQMLQNSPVILNYVRREVLDPASTSQLLQHLVSLIQSEVQRARADGVASTQRPESVQIIQILVRQMGVLALQPLIDTVWQQVEPDPGVAKPGLHVSVDVPAAST